MSERILVTAALPYANGPLHIGHVAGAYLPADLYCRYQRLRGRDLVFVCGSDEHGVAIIMRAMSEGVTPQDIVDRYHPQIEAAFDKLGMSFDYYGRTSSQTHHETARDFFATLDAKDVFKLKAEEQPYDPEAEIFLADRFIRGTCPVCGYDDAYGDQCEKCGSSLSPRELINPRSALTDATPVWKATTHWYMPLGDFQAQLEAWVATHPEWKPNVLGQIRSWFKAGLADRAITRDLPWGVEVPETAAERAGEATKGKVIYVWFDAPIGYISATREWAAQQGDPDAWKRYWQDEDTKLVHFIGKDNIVFHCIMFPAMLMAHGDYVLPDNVPANEFLNLEGQKFSTSRNWAVWLHEALDTFDPDLLRYALATGLPETKDADFSWKDFQSRINDELADVLGNFVNRTLTFAHRFFEGEVPTYENPSATDEDVLAHLADFPERIGKAYETYHLREAVSETMGLARMGNKYFNDTEPWHTRKKTPQAAANTIHVSLQLCAALAVLMEPVLPQTAERLRGMLRLTDLRTSLPGDTGRVVWDKAGMSLLPEGHRLGEPGILFQKLEDDVIDAQIAKLGAADLPATDAPAFPPLGEDISFDDFSKLDLRIGRILAADRVPKTDKLLRFDVDLGFEHRQILSGIAEQFTPEEMVGKTVVVVANLKPRKIRGLESAGMLLMAEDTEGKLALLTAESQPGAPIS